MFVRLKNVSNRANVTLVASKISDITKTPQGTVVAMDNGRTHTVEDSERVVRSKMLKAGDPASNGEEA